MWRTFPSAALGPVLLVASVLLLAPPSLAAKPKPKAPPATEPAPTHRTDIIFLRDLPARRAAAIYERVLGTPPPARVVVGDTQNTIVVHDTPPRLDRFRGLLEALDLPGSAKFKIYVRPVLYRAPSELAALIAEAVAARKQEVPLTMVPDDRSWQLVVQTTGPIYTRFIDRLARRLDVPRRPGDRGVRVVPERR